MKKLKILSHCSYIGNTGINSHSRNFFRALSKVEDVKVRNFTIGPSWKGGGFRQHDGEEYLNEVDKKILYQQTLWTEGNRVDYQIYNEKSGPFDLNLVADIGDHYYYYENYTGPKIGYFAWETTRVPDGFFNKLKEFDEVWVTSGWQKQCMIDQGFDPSKLQIVPEAVETDTFFPEEISFDEYYSDGRFKFVVFGRWEYRKATKEIIETFLKTFDKSEPVDLILSVDNGWPEDKCKTTEERLKHYGFNDSRLKVVHFPKRKDYARFLKKGHVFLSCSRGEGWNLPLIEAMACGIPAIYSNCSAQLEYASGKGHPVNILGESKCPTNVGNYYDPDFNHLSKVMRDVYKNYKQYKIKALKDSEEIGKVFTWENAAKFASERINEVYKNYYNKKMKILFIAPHLSTGGCPQYLLKKIKVLSEENDVYCIEYANYGIYAVQRNQIKDLLKDRFFELPENKDTLNDIIDKIKPDVVHLEEMPEYFMDGKAKDRLYRHNRPYTLIETSHDSSFNPNTKTVIPDKLMLVSEYQKNNLKPLDIPMEVHEYPIVVKPRKQREEALKVLGLDPNKKHVLHVGLFTPRKNQAEIVEYAKRLHGYPIQFHFVGNQAPNFKHYWEPIMKDFPSNCTWWNERKDVDNFYQAADLFLFVSREYPGDKETSPLVIREAISNNVPSLIHNIPVYMGMYDKYDNIEYLDVDDKDVNINKILSMLNIKSSNGVFHTKHGEKDLSLNDYPNSANEVYQKFGEEAVMYWATFIFKELERFNVDIRAGDVFVDLGANIGISSRYAKLKGVKEIYAFEPDPIIGEIYKKNCPESKLYRYAIDSKKSEIELYHWPYNDRERGPKYKVETITLKDVIDVVGKPIDYLKMDIEGFEESAFDDLSYEDCSKIKKLYFEHHNPSNTNAIADKLRNKGYDVDIEWGAGQNYIYAVHNSDSKNLNRFIVSYDKNDNKIFFRSKKEYDNLLVSIKELDSNAVVWSSKYEKYHKDCQFWIIPAPKGYIDFETSPFFGGILVEFYSNNVLICKEEIRIKPPIKDKLRLVSTNLTEPTYMNYVEFFVEKIYDKYLKDKNFDVVVDVGANIGLWSEYIRHVAKCKHIYAIEPNKTALKVLKDTFSSDTSITIVDKAMANVDGELEFFIDEKNSTISSLASFGSLTKSYKVNSIKFSSFLKEYKVNKVGLLKVDIETGEYDLFDSLSEKDFSSIENILVEYHLTNGRTLDGDVKKLTDTLEKFGYELEVRNMHGLGGFIFATKKIKTENIIEVVQTKPKQQKDIKEIFIVGAYPDLEEKEVLLNDTVSKLKALGKTVLLASHYPIAPHIVEKVDYYIYDAYNMMSMDHTLDKDGPDYWMENGSFRLEAIVSSHVSSICRIFGLCMEFIKSLNYDYFVILESDSTFDIEDLKKYEEIKKNVIDKGNTLFFCKPRRVEFCWFDSPVYETYSFGGFVKEFDKRFKFPINYDDWNNLLNSDRKNNCFEYIIYNAFKENEQNYHMLGTLKSYFVNSKIDLFSVGDPIGIYYNSKDENRPIIFLSNQNGTKKYNISVSGKYLSMEKELGNGCWWMDEIDISQHDSSVYIVVEENGRVIKRFRQNVTKDFVKKLKNYKIIKFN